MVTVQVDVAVDAQGGVPDGFKSGQAMDIVAKMLTLSAPAEEAPPVVVAKTIGKKPSTIGKPGKASEEPVTEVKSKGGKAVPGKAPVKPKASMTIKERLAAAKR